MFHIFRHYEAKKALVIGYKKELPNTGYRIYSMRDLCGPVLYTRVGMRFAGENISREDLTGTLIFITAVTSCTILYILDKLHGTSFLISINNNQVISNQHIDRLRSLCFTTIQ